MYRIVPDAAVLEQVAALPIEAAASYAEVLKVLALEPWNGDSHNDENPNGAVRRWVLNPGAAGHVIYLILEDQREVHVVMVQWWG